MGTGQQAVMSVSFGSRSLPGSCSASVHQTLLAVAFPRLLVIWAACVGIDGTMDKSHPSWEVLDKWLLEEV